jgi:hypothetical protein
MNVGVALRSRYDFGLEFCGCKLFGFFGGIDEAIGMTAISDHDK